jgi:hypothetical protein
MDEYEMDARRILLTGLDEALKLTPREQAEAAHCAGGPSVDELEQMVIASRLRNAPRQVVDVSAPLES